MIPGVPVGTVCAFAGHVTRSTSGKNTIWSDTDCGKGALGAEEARTAGSGEALETEASPTILVEALGWMLCDGRFLAVAAYPALFRVLAYRYGQGTDASGGNTFRLPDCRGLFLRGVDDGAGLDPGAGSRVGPQGTGTSPGVGSLQCDTLQDHQHDYDAVQSATPAKEGNAGAFTTTARPTTSPVAPARTSAETRPRNIAVNYIIKVR